MEDDAFDFDKAMAEAWRDARKLIREQGYNPDQVIREAGENLEAWRHASRPGCLFDGLEPGVYWLSCSCPRCTPWC